MNCEIEIIMTGKWHIRWLGGGEFHVWVYIFERIIDGVFLSCICSGGFIGGVTGKSHWTEG
jgi:hypothetical protein